MLGFPFPRPLVLQCGDYFHSWVNGNFGEFSTFLKCMSFPVISAMNISVISTQTNSIYVSNEVFQWLWLSLLFTY